jgi:imidazolonepropionase-like amidohydrolase
MTTTPAIYHVRGIFLPDESERDAWIVDGRLTFERRSGAVTLADRGWILPGFVDAHCHVGMSPSGHKHDPETQAEHAIANRDAGALLIRDAGSPVDNTSVQQREDLPRLIRAGRHIARKGRYIRGLGIDIEPEDLVATVEAQAARGDGWVKIAADWIDRSVGDLTQTFPDAELAAGIARAHELGVRVAAHVFGEDALPGLIAAGIDSIEHGTGLTDDVLGEVARRGIAVVPTLINIDTFPQIASQGEAKFPLYAAHMRSLFSTSRDRVRAAYEAGIALYTGTDAGGSQPHGLIREEIRALVGAGIPQGDVIAQASWRGREWLGLQGLVEGAEADFIVYGNDPRANLEPMYSPQVTVLRGKPIPGR